MGSNQYRTRPGVAPDENSGLDLMQQAAGGGAASNYPISRAGDAPARMRCGEVWGTLCKAWVTGPSWRHGGHGNADDFIAEKDIGPTVFGALPIDVLIDLSVDRSPLVRAAVAHAPLCPPSLRDELSKDHDPVVRRHAVAGCTDLDQLAVYLRRRTKEDYEGVAANPLATIEMLQTVAGGSGSGSRAMRLAVRHPNCSPALLQWAVQRKNGGLLQAVVDNPQLTPALLEAVARNPSVRAATATQMLQQSTCSPDVVAALTNHVDPLVRQGVVAHPLCSPAIIKKLAHDPEPMVRTTVATSLACPPDLLTHLAQDHVLMVRRVVACNPQTPAEGVDRLAQDPSPIVRLCALHHPSTDVNRLERLADDPDAGVRRAVARHPACSPAQLQRFLTDDNNSVRDSALNNPNMPEIYRNLYQLSI